MNPLRGFTAPSPDSVRTQWRTASIETTWLEPGDWYHPAVDALVEAVCERRDTTASAERLGRARGEAGVSIRETIDDVMCLYRARGLAPDLALLRALAVGWVAGYETIPVIPQLVDAESGLATSGYFELRLRECYDRADQDPSAARLGLLVINMTVQGLTVWERAARSAAAGQALTRRFGVGHPMACLGGGLFVVLIKRTEDERAFFSQIRFELERAVLTQGVTLILRNPPRMWVEPLPTTHDFAVELLKDLKRS